MVPFLGIITSYKVPRDCFIEPPTVPGTVPKGILLLTSRRDSKEITTVRPFTRN